MFFLKDLKAFALEKLKQKLKSLWMSDSFLECIQEVYTSTYEHDHAMRSVVVNAAANHVHELVSKRAFQDLLRDGGDFVVDYFKELELKVDLIDI